MDNYDCDFKKETFEKIVLKIALPVTLQSLLQSSFSVIDQVMIGQLGSGSIAGIGLGGKFASLYSVVLAAIASVAGIMISQYLGRKDERSAAKNFSINMAMSVGLAVVFTVLSVVFPDKIMALYTKDEATRTLAVQYLRIYAISFLPMAVSFIAATMLRCREKATQPLYASIFALVLNTGLNYLLIFGKWIFPAMGVKGAALASVVAQAVSCMVLLIFLCLKENRGKEPAQMGTVGQEEGNGERVAGETDGLTSYGAQYLKILCPMLLCEFLWSLGENVYTAIYGNIGTDACAAMTMTIPVQTIVIGALSGLSQAAGILIGKSLGAGKYEQAYTESKKLMIYGLAASIVLSVALVAVSPFYVRIFNVEPSVQAITRSLLIAIAVIAPVKVLNMILGGGIIRSGGKTAYTMWIDLIGTWVFGVPLGLLSAFVWNLDVQYVYFILSLEECVRLGISIVIFRRRVWMERIR